MLHRWFAFVFLPNILVQNSNDEILDFKPDVLVFLFESLYTEKLTTLKD